VDTSWLQILLVLRVRVSGPRRKAVGRDSLKSR
jgi:hypothetical protein